MRAVAWFWILAACGRYGFEPSTAADGAVGGKVIGNSDGATASGDGGVAIDSPAGFGGYTLTDSTAPYVLLSGTVVPGFVVLADDENYAMTLPFTFKFYGVDYTSVTISMNGYLTFDTPVVGAETQLNDCGLDATPPGATIAVFWDDLYANNTAPSTGRLSYLSDGTAPDRRLTIEWRDMDAYYVAGANSFTQGVRVTHEVVLHETGTIEMRYGPRTAPAYPNKDCGADRHRGCSATIGLEASGSQLFDNVQCGTGSGPGPGYTPINEGRMFTFVPN
jgi:hypothetical protein